jgi:hypothetical protein
MEIENMVFVNTSTIDLGANVSDIRFCTNNNTTTPALKLAITGTATFSSSVTATSGYFSANTGIGTTSPASLLHVGAATNFAITGRTSAVYASADSTTIFTIGRSGVDYPILLDFGVNNASQYATISAIQYTGSNKPLALQPSGGNLLVGTTTDSGEKLQVNGDGLFSGNLSITKDNPKLFLNDNSGGSQNNYSINSQFGIFNLNDETTGGNSVFSYGGGLFNFTGTTTIQTLEIKNGVTAAVAIASTHKVSILINGVQYYLLATNV